MPDMSMFGPFDARTIEPDIPRVALPAGWYDCIISASENKTTKKGTGTMLCLAFTIINGEFRQRKLFARLNLINPEPEAVRIARSQLAAICRAVNVPKPGVSEQLHNKPLSVRIITKPRPDTGEAVNECKDFKPLANATQQDPAPQQAGYTQPPPQQGQPPVQQDYVQPPQQEAPQQAYQQAPPSTLTSGSPSPFS